MNYLMEVALNDGTAFNWSKKELVVGGKVYKDRIKSLTQHSVTLTSDRKLKTPVMELKIQDTDKAVRSHFKDGLDSQKNSNSSATLKKIDGTTTLAKLKLTDFKIDNQYSFITFTQNTDLIKNNLLDEISEQEYPDAVGDAYGKAIPYQCGQVVSGGNNGTYSAWKVNLDIGGGTILHYLLSWKHLTSVDRVMHAGTNIASGSWTLVNHTDGLAYLTYTGGTADTIEVNVTRTISSSLSTVISTVFDDLFGAYGYTPTSDFITKLNSNGIPASSLRFCLDNQLIGEKFMYYFTQYYGCEWFLKKNGEIGLSWIDFKPCAGNEQASFIESDTEGKFKQEQKSNEIKNELLWKFKYLNTSKAYKFEFTFNKTESQQNAGIFNDTLEGRFSDNDVNFFPGVKYFANINQYPQYVGTQKFTGPEHVEKFLDMDLGDIIKLTHKNALTKDARYYRIEKMDFYLDKNYVIATLRDVTFLNKIESHTFLFQSGNYGVKSASQYVYDFAPNRTHRIQKYGNIRHSTTQKKFEDSSLYFDGSIQGIRGLNNGNDDFKLQGDTYDFLYGGWFWLQDGTPTSICDIMGLYQNNDNRIQLRLLVDGSLEFAVRVAGVNQLAIGSAAAMLNDQTWYLIVVAKIGTLWGVYRGTSIVSQIMYGSYAAGNYINPDVFVGMRGSLSNYMEGYGDEFFTIQNNNAWSLVPNVGKTDSFTAPVKPFSDRFLRVA
jgi:hypothetical protein